MIVFLSQIIFGGSALIPDEPNFHSTPLGMAHTHQTRTHCKSTSNHRHCVDQSARQTTPRCAQRAHHHSAQALMAAGSLNADVHHAVNGATAWPACRRPDQRTQPRAAAVTSAHETCGRKSRSISKGRRPAWHANRARNKPLSHALKAGGLKKKPRHCHCYSALVVIRFARASTAPHLSPCNLSAPART